jgi:hypothetical protein
MADTDTTTSIAGVAASIRNVAEGRAALGKASELLQDGYSRLGLLPDSLFDSADVRAAGLSLLDSTNNYAQKVYAEVNYEGPDIGAQALDTVQALKVGGVLEMSRKALRRVEEAAKETYWDFTAALKEVIQAVAEGAKVTIETVAKGAMAASSALLVGFWPWLLVLALVGLVLWKSGLLRAGAKLAVVA